MRTKASVEADLRLPNGPRTGFYRSGSSRRTFSVERPLLRLLVLLACIFGTPAQAEDWVCPNCRQRFQFPTGADSHRSSFISRHQSACRPSSGGSWSTTRPLADVLMDKSRDLILEGDKVLKNKQYQAALSYFEQALALRTGNDGVARARIQSVKEWQASDAIGRGNALYEQRLYARAIEEYRSALAFVPNHQVALGNIALANGAIQSEIRYRMEEDQRTREWVQSMLDRSSRSAAQEAARNLANENYLKAKNAHANRQYDEAIRLVEAANLVAPDPFYMKVLKDIRTDKLLDQAHKAAEAEDYARAKELAQEAKSTELYQYYSGQAQRAERRQVMNKETAAMTEQRRITLVALAASVSSGGSDANFDTAGLDTPGLRPQVQPLFGIGGDTNGVQPNTSTATSTSSNRASINGTNTSAGSQLLAATSSVVSANAVMDGQGARGQGSLPVLTLQGLPKNLPKALDVSNLPRALTKDPQRMQAFNKLNDQRNKSITRYLENRQLREALVKEREAPEAKPDPIREIKIEQAESNMDQANAEIEFRNREIKLKFGINVREDEADPLIGAQPAPP